VKKPVHTDQAEDSKDEELSEPAKKSRLRWSEMLKRVFKIDVTVCLKCGGRLEQIAVIRDHVVAKAILKSLNEVTIFKPLKFVEVRGPPAASSFDNEFDQRESW
jgi:hypothetical protein